MPNLIEMLSTFFRESGLMPHGYCLIWNPLLLWSHIIADSFIFIAYLLIPAAIYYFSKKRTDLSFKSVYTLFYSFILMCGITHFLSIVVLWKPIYGIEAILKLITAAVSITTAIMVWKLMPILISIPTPKQLEEKNEMLTAATDELTRINKSLEYEVDRRVKQIKKVNEELLNFTYIISHDLKEPVRGISQFTSFIMEDYADKLDEEGTEYLNVIQHSARHMNSLLDSLLEYSRASNKQYHVDSLNIKEVVNDSLKTLALTIQENNIHITTENLDINLSAGRTRLIQVFINLISNAIKYADKTKSSCHVTISTKVIDGINTFIITDNGIGINPDKLDDCFQVFRRLHGKEEFGGGNGIGLSICKKIVENHNGKIWIESTLKEGTSVFFTLGENCSEQQQ